MDVRNIEKQVRKYSLTDLADIAGGLIKKGKGVPLDKHWADHAHINEMLSGNSFSFFTMVDYQVMKYVFVSSSIKNVLGYSNDFYLKAGLEFAFESIHPEDRNKLKALHKKMFEFFYKASREDRKKFKFDFNIRVLKANQEYVHLLYQTIFVELTNVGEPSLDCCTCTDISRYKSDNNMKLTVYHMERDGYHQVYEYEISDLGAAFTPRQVEIIELIAKGLTSSQIADKLTISIETVKNHRKKILHATGAKNIAEAMKISYGR